MAVHTGHGLVLLLLVGIYFNREQGMRQFRVASKATVLRDNFVARFDLNGFVVALESKGERMEEPIVRLCDPLSDGVVGKVTVVANGHMVMAAVLPSVVIILHNMAIHAGFRRIAEIAGPFAIAKGEGTYSKKNASKNRDGDQRVAGDSGDRFFGLRFWGVFSLLGVGCVG